MIKTYEVPEHWQGLCDECIETHNLVSLVPFDKNAPDFSHVILAKHRVYPYEFGYCRGSHQKPSRIFVQTKNNPYW